MRGFRAHGGFTLPLATTTTTIYLNNGDSQDEPGWGTVGIAVKVPLAVDLAWQSLVGNVSDQLLGQSQAHLISETTAFYLPAPL